MEAEKYEAMQENSQEGKYLAFGIGIEEYAIEIRFVTEIIGIQKITSLPELPEYIKGVINLRGKVIPVIDVRLRFKQPERTYDDRTCIIVVNIRGISVGLIVDSVQEVLDITQEQIDPPPALKKESEHRFINGLGKIAEGVKIILDANKFLFDKEAKTITTTVSDINNKDVA